MNILVTVGSMQGRSFSRLFQIIDELCDEGILSNDTIIAQTGYDKYESKFYKTFDLTSDEEFKELIKKSDVIISHAGTGTVTSCLKQHKKVILFPRLSKYNEHYDDHQIELCEFFQMNNYVLVAKDKKELVNCLRKVRDFQPEEFQSNKESFNRLILKALEGWNLN